VVTTQRPIVKSTVDPELERLLQDMKRLRLGIAALEERMLQYLAARNW
jgi:hypothetical protein